MADLCVQILAATLGTLGFCLTFHVDRRHILVPTVGGGVCWVIYLFLSNVVKLSLFPATFVTSFFIGVYGEIMSHWREVPTTVYFIPSCIPLIPGGNLYYMLTGLLDADYAAASENAIQLVLYTLGIASGLAAVMELDHMRRRLMKEK